MAPNTQICHVGLFLFRRSPVDNRKELLVRPLPGTPLHQRWGVVSGTRDAARRQARDDAIEHFERQTGIDCTSGPLLKRADESSDEVLEVCGPAVSVASVPTAQFDAVVAKVTAATPRPTNLWDTQAIGNFRWVRIADLKAVEACPDGLTLSQKRVREIIDKAMSHVTIAKGESKWKSSS